MTRFEKGTFVIIPNKNYLSGKAPELQTIFFWICNYADNGGMCFPSRSKIAKHSGCSVRTVDKYLKILEEDGVLSKNPRYGEKFGRTSNIYQVHLLHEVEQEISHPRANESTTPSVVSCALTQPDINSTNITQLDTSHEVSQDDYLDRPNQREEKSVTDLPLKFGKTSLLRLHHIYRCLWYRKYGTQMRDNQFGKFGKIFKGLLKNNSEMQISVLLLTFFNWYGGSGNDEKENKYLSSIGFPLEMMIKKIDIMIAYLTNNIGLIYTNDEDVKKYAVKNLKNIL